MKSSPAVCSRVHPELSEVTQEISITGIIPLEAFRTLHRKGPTTPRGLTSLKADPPREQNDRHMQKHYLAPNFVLLGIYSLRNRFAKTT